MPPFASTKVDSEVGRDPVKPRRKARTRLEFAEVFVGTNETLLRQLQCVFLIVDHRQGNPNDSPLIAFDQNTESARVTLLRTFDEFAFVARRAQCSVQKT